MFETHYDFKAVTLLKDLPGCPAGSMFMMTADGTEFFNRKKDKDFIKPVPPPSYKFTSSFVNENKDWFSDRFGHNYSDDPVDIEDMMINLVDTITDSNPFIVNEDGSKTCKLCGKTSHISPDDGTDDDTDDDLDDEQHHDGCIVLQANNIKKNLKE